MKYKQLKGFLNQVSKCPYFDKSNSKCTCIPKFKPVINVLKSTQKYLVISSDPSGDTDKSRDIWEPHSDFEVRFISLIFTGSDEDKEVKKVKSKYKELKKTFLKYFYWTHFNKCFANGSPNGICANYYLKDEIKLFEPKLIIILGLKPAQFLLGVKSLGEAVNKIHLYNSIPTIVSLHPSKNWNKNRRPMYKFNETWNLIRKNIEYKKIDKTIIDTNFL